MEYMCLGDLVPDFAVREMVLGRGNCLRCFGGFLLDGFPRTLPQAEQLKLFMDERKPPLGAVVDYQMSMAEIVLRLSGRRRKKASRTMAEECFTSEKTTTSRQSAEAAAVICVSSAVRAAGSVTGGRHDVPTQTRACATSA